MSQRLNKKLLELKDNGLYPFHMPGHKRNMANVSEKNSYGELLQGAYEIDITEIDGFDNLHDAKDLIKNAEERAAKLYKSEETHFLVNGSTSGILSAISAVCNKGDKIIVARNCHISVYNAIEINELKPIYVYPELIEIEDKLSKKFEKSKDTFYLAGSIRVEEVEKAIVSNLDAKAVIITSPTYDGVISDVAAIAKLAHEYDIPLIVDEAHGALFFLEGRSAVDNKADIVINSVHKTLPAFTQTALIHVNGKLVDRNRIKKFLRIYQTSSPSYILMGSIDYAIEIMETKGRELYRDFCIKTAKLKEAFSILGTVEYLSKDKLVRLGAFDFDESKILISSGRTGLRGIDICEMLRNKYQIQPEMTAGKYVLLMTTLFDTDDGIEKLSEAIYEIDSEYRDENKLQIAFDKIKQEKKIKLDQEIEKLQWLKGEIGNPSEYTVFAYPPGIPIIVESEIVTEKIYAEIEDAIYADLDIKWIK